MSAAKLPARVRRAVQARAFLVQGSWNYRVMQGLGMAFAILPVLRHLRGADALPESLARHSEHFNAHPYLSSVALGALARLELDGEAPETVRRFRAAIRGPLGALGDRLVWATWLPLSAAGALVVHWLGAPGWVAVAAFLLVFNSLHLAMRLRGFEVGFQAGTQVGVRLRTLGVSGVAERLSGLQIFLVGLLGGVLLQGEFVSQDGVGIGWAGAAVLAFLVGIAGGVRLWRPTAILTVASVVLLLLFGLRAS